MTVWYLNKFCKCKHTEQLLYTKPCRLVLKLSLAQQQDPAMAAYGGGSINKHLGLSAVTRTPRLTHIHTHFLDTITAACSGRGYTDTIGEYKESLGLVYCSWEGSLLTNALSLSFVLGIWLLSRCLKWKRELLRLPCPAKRHLNGAHACWRAWRCWDQTCDGLLAMGNAPARHLSSGI